MNHLVSVRSTCLALLLLFLIGCGDSPELNMQRAQIALSNGKPDQALKLVESVLAEKPGQYQPMLLKAEAQMQLKYLDDSRVTLDELLALHSDKIEVHRSMIKWVLRQMNLLIRRTEFETDEILQGKYEDARKVGLDEAKWLELNVPDDPDVAAKRKAEAEFRRANYAEIDADRLRISLIRQRKTLEPTELGSDVSDIERQREILVERMERQIDGRLATAEGHLRAAIEADPKHFLASNMYARILEQRERWDDFWRFSEAISQSEDITSRLAKRLVDGLVRIPDQDRSPLDRIGLGRKILNAVKKEQQDRPEWLFSSAQLHLGVGEWVKAQALLEQGLEKQPSDIDGRHMLARSLYYQGQYEQAKDILEKLRKKKSRSPVIETLYGRTLMKTGNLVLAKESLRRAVDLTRDLKMDYPEAREAFLELMFEEGHIGEAMDDVEKFLKSNPSNPRAIQFKMNFDIANGRRDEVADLLGGVESISPLRPQHMRILVDGYTYLRQFDKAQWAAQQLVNQNPDLLENHLILAGTLLMQGEDAQVKQMLIDLKQQFPESASVNQMLGQMYLGRQSYDQAVDLLQEAVDEDPGNHNARLSLAQGLMGLSLPEEAIEQIQEVLDSDPQHVRAHAVAVQLYERLGQPAKANQHLDQIDERQINERTNPVLLAQLKLKRGDVEGAKLVCNRAITAGRASASVRRMLAGIYERNEEINRAEEQFVDLVRVYPNDFQNYDLLRRFYLRQGMIEKGVGQLIELQVLSPISEPLSRITQAALLQSDRRYDEAISRLEPIYEPLIRRRHFLALEVADAMSRIHLKSGNAKSADDVYLPLVQADLFTPEVKLRRIRLMAGSVSIQDVVQQLDDLTASLTESQRRLRYQVMLQYVQLGQFDRAMAIVDEWIAKHPKKAVPLRWKGNLLIQMNRVDDAIAVFRQAVELSPDIATNWRKLAQAHLAKFDYPGAEAVRRQASEVDSGSRIMALASLGRMYVNLGLNRQAAATFDELERFGRPRDPRVLLAMGQAYAALNNDDQARQRLIDIPDYAPQYASAQVLLGRLEQRMGMIQEARDRLENLARDRRFAGAAVQELVSLKFKNRTEEDLIRWSDNALSIEKLPVALKLKWLSVRVGLAAGSDDWPAVLDVLERMSELNPDSLRLIAGRIVLMLKLRQMEEAGRLFRITPDLMNTPIGPLLATIVNELPEQQEEAPNTLATFLQHMIQGKLDEARSVSESLPPMRTIYKDDLLAIANRPDAGSRDMSLACAHMGLALIALEYALVPALAETISRGVIERQPGLAPAYGILARSLLDQGKPLNDVIVRARNALPESSLGLFLSARQYDDNKQFDESVASLEKLIQREPSNPHTQYFLAQMLQKSGRIDDTIALLEKIHQDQNSPYRLFASNDLAYLLAENHPDRMDEAYQIADEAFQRAPTMMPLLDTIGWIEHLRGNDEQSLEHLNRAILGLNKVAEVHYHLGVVYHQLGNTTWALYHLQEAAVGDPTRPDVLKAKALMESIKSQ